MNQWVWAEGLRHRLGRGDSRAKEEVLLWSCSSQRTKLIVLEERAVVTCLRRFASFVTGERASAVLPHYLVNVVRVKQASVVSPPRPESFVQAALAWVVCPLHLASFALAKQVSAVWHLHSGYLLSTEQAAKATQEGEPLLHGPALLGSFDLSCSYPLPFFSSAVGPGDSTDRRVAL